MHIGAQIRPKITESARAFAVLQTEESLAGCAGLLFHSYAESLSG
jgi:hypothetical protein